eukprot:Gb_10211 [translate_table: standard]
MHGILNVWITVFACVYLELDIPETTQAGSFVPLPSFSWRAADSAQGLISLEVTCNRWYFLHDLMASRAVSERSEMRNGGSKNVSRRVSIWKLFKYADCIDVLMMVFGTLGSIGDGLATPGFTIIGGNLVNSSGSIASVNPDDFMHQINKKVVRFLFLAAGVWVAAFAEAFCWTRTGERQASRMRTMYLRAVLRQDVSFFDTRGTDTAEVVNSVSNDTLVIQDALSEKVPIFIMNSSTFIFCYAAGFYLSWRLALVTFPFVTLLIIPGLIYGQTLIGLARKMHAEYNSASTIVEQALSSIRTVYSFVGEEKTMAKFSSALDGTVKLGLKQGLAKGLAIGSNGVTFAIWGFMAWYGSRLVMYHGVSAGMILSTGFAIVLGGLALGTALPNLKYFSEACIAAHRIFETIDRVPEINSDDMTGNVLEKVSGEVEFRNVEFAYPSRPDTIVFHNFCLTIPAGQTVALVGCSGSGKSTAISLLERFYDPLSGEILLDGENIQNLQLKWLRNQIGLVSQEPALFATSIHQNLLFGKEESNMEEVMRAAKAANAHKFISKLPDGYNTQVGERGVQMSGGQKQRIAIARAILKDPPILLLDEATSALDAESEKVVQDALDKASMGRTTIVVAHRLSTIRNADKISVVQAGQVIESGRHDQLMHKVNGAYAALVRLQQSTQKQEEIDGTALASHASSSVSPARISSQLSMPNSAQFAMSSQLEDQVSDVAETMPTKSPSFRRLLAMNAPEWKHAVMGCAGAMGYGALQPAYSFTLASMIHVLFVRDHDEMKSKIRIYSTVFTALAALSFLVNLVQHYNFAAMGEFLTRRIRQRMLSKILTFEVGWFDKDENSSGAVCSRLATDANMASDRVSLTVECLSTVIISFTLGLFIAWRLAIVMIAVQPIIISCYYTKRVLLKSMSHKSIKAQEQGSQLAAESVINHRTITAFCSQERIRHLFVCTQEGPRRENRKQSWYAGVALGTSQALTLCNWALVFWYGGKLLEHGHISFDGFLKTMFILVRTGKVIADAGSMTSDLAKGADAVQSVFAILDRNSRINPDAPEGLKLEKLEGNVEVKNVDFAYPSRPDIIIFRNFCLRINAGSSMAVVGESGSGKSTIIGLIERFYDPLRGQVMIDCKDIKRFNLRCMRQHIALVGQEPTLFAGSIRENIMYGNDDATEAEMIEAAKVANAHQFISCLKNGYETNTGDRGVQLSGGQKQRIAIARAIIKNPIILLLDEATSALDAQSEKVVQEALDRIMVGRTSIIVAHRLITIQTADCIAVIQDGRIVEQGSHSSLISKGEHSAYFSLIKLQQHHNHDSS